MITDALSQGDLIAELHLESLFNSGATHAEPEVHFPREQDAVRLRHRLALIDKLAIDAQGLSFKRDQGMGSIASGSSAALRAAAIVANWRTYLPEDCVAAMIKDGWHWST
jgi:hypothetical protein